MNRLLLTLIPLWTLFASALLAENYSSDEIIQIDNPLEHASTAPSPIMKKSLHGVLYYDKGVWFTGYRHLQNFLSYYGMSYETMNSDDITAGKLDPTKHQFLIMPGGQSWTYLDDLEEAGGEAIKEYVQAGGGYVGICAGAFYAMSDREGGYATGPYGIGLIEGVGYDGTQLGVSPFKVGMLDFNFSWPGLAHRYKIVLLEGPSMLVEDDVAEAAGLQVVAKFPLLYHPAMVLFDYGKGKVFLSGPHPEIEEHLLNWGSEFRDPETDWPILDQMIKAVTPEN